MKNIYRIIVAVTIVFVALYFSFYTERAGGYLSTLIFFALSSTAVMVKKDIDLSMLWVSLPASILVTAFIFKTHLYPEIMILAMNRLYLVILSFIPFKKTKEIRIISLIYCNLIVFLVLIELLLNLIFMIYPFEVLKRKTDIFRLAPSTTFNNSPVNEDGYMGRRVSDEKKERRILFIGDSFGVGVVDYKHNFIQMIDDSTEYECINLSQPGYSPVDYLRELKTNFDKACPDLVIIIIFAGNDILNIAVGENNWSIDNFKSINLIRNADVFLKERKRIKKETESFSMTRETFLEVEKRRMKVNEKDSLKREWSLFEKTIDEMKVFLDGKNRRYLFLIIPDEFSINENLQRDLGKDDSVDWLYSVKRIADLLDERGIEHINSTKSLQEAFKAGVNPYRENDTHVNEYGNYILFNELKKYIDFTER
ncbi:MAG: hypothetical protein AB7T10_07315 [bacterium]